MIECVKFICPSVVNMLKFKCDSFPLTFIEISLCSDREHEEKWNKFGNGEIGNGMIINRMKKRDTRK